MKKITIIIALAVFTLSSVYARNSKDYSIESNNSTVSANKTNISNCNSPTTEVDLDINNVRVKILGAGDMWWNGVSGGGQKAKYQYPKIDETSGEVAKNVLFNGVLWFTGKDDGGATRCASQLYRSDGYDFWTGPLQNFGLIEADVCEAFDHHFVVYGSEIDLFLKKFEESGSVGVADVPENVLYWPGKGNPHLLNSDDPIKQGWYFNEGSLAPFLDNDGDGMYDPLKGDFPVISNCDAGTVSSGDGIQGNYADQMIFWVINDEGNTHTNSKGTDIGIQINCLAFAWQTSNEINDMTFYTYEIIKKTAGDLTETYMSVTADPDIGDYADDFIGCDTVRNVGYCFNGDGFDNDYGDSPPLIGIDFFEGPIFDNGVDSFELGLTTFMYFNSGAGNTGDPSEVKHYRNYQTGFWQDGSEMTIGGSGTGSGTPIKFAYPGNPGLGEYWSECNTDGAGAKNTPADRRFVLSSGPFTLNTAQTQRISVGVMIAETDQVSQNSGCPDFEILMGSANNRAQALFDNCFGIQDGPDAPTLVIRELDNSLIINLRNIKGSNNYAEAYDDVAAGSNGAIHSDTSYTFEGYKVYQLADASITAKDLGDASKAKIVFESDIKNGVSKVFDYSFDNDAQMYVPILQADGYNVGITKTFEVTDDLFATGETGLVNYKPYYYAAVAYAYNNFLQFEAYDPNNGKSQLNQYLQGRKNFKVYSAVPHNVTSESGGTVLNSKYGQGLEVKRVEGRGNGGKSIELTAQTMDNIVANDFEDIITYKPLRDPLGVMVVDPLFVKDVDFSLSIKNDLVNEVTDSSYWVLDVFDKNGLQIDTVFSDRNMDRPYDQILEDYGIILNVGNPISINTNHTNNELVFDLLSTEIKYQDESKRWLNFYRDEIAEGGTLSPSNWVGTGSFKAFSNDWLLQVFDAHQYDEFANSDPNRNTFYDKEGLYGNMLDAGFAPYCLSSNYKISKSLANSSIDPDDNNSRKPFSSYGPAFLWDKYGITSSGDTVFNPVNTLDRLQSIDIVMTPDKTKWTKCVVFETSDDEELLTTGVRKGMLRTDASIDEDGDEVVGETGRSFFPGYAVNLETGERLNIAFGESSDRSDNNGNDMIWNPTDKVTDKFTKVFKTPHDRPVYGGKHFIYVFDSKYDEGDAVKAVFDADYNPSLMLTNNIPNSVKEVYEDILYTSIPILADGFELLSLEDGLIPNADTIKVRVQRPFESMFTSETLGANSNDSLPRYEFSTKGMAPTTNVKEVAESALDNIRVVPNPYYAYSSYEVGSNSSVVKITNLPDVCKVSIFTMDGKLVKKFDRSVGSGGALESNKQDLSLGQPTGTFNLDNSISWNIKNHKDIPVASGTYMIYVDAPGIGHKVVKCVVFVRPPDISDF